MEPIYVTKPALPPLEEYTELLRGIWERRLLTNCGPLHTELEAALTAFFGVETVLFTNGHTALEFLLQTLPAGEIITTPFTFASTANAIIIGFNVRPNEMAQAAAKRDNVDMRMYRVIYDAINEITDAMKGMLAPKYREAIIGHAEVRQTYHVSAIGTIAGCYVKGGKITRDASVRVLRDNIVIHEGNLGSLQRFKDSVKEVAAGFECGTSLEKYNDIKEGDIFECFVMEEIKE